jgi:hypothetical protein
MTSLFGLLVLLLAGSPLFAQPCATVSLGVTPTTVGAGDPFALSVAIANCSDRPQLVGATISISGPGFAHTFRILVPMRRNLDFAHTFMLRAPHHPGVYRVAVTLSTGSSTEAVLTVVE